MADDGDIFYPDLIVTQQGNAYEVAINSSTLPDITVATDIETDDALKPVLKKAKAEAAALQAAMMARANLLTTLMGFVVIRQSRFMTDGEESLVPLTMAEVADHLNCHPSTVTRLVKDKLVLTPRGIIPLSHFFSPAISGKEVSDVASRAVAATLVALITTEDKSAPLSDTIIADAIESRHGIRLTPRSIAKQRQKLHIAKASERRNRSSPV
jgi:RNA polymerase sigma-54 factor